MKNEFEEICKRQNDALIAARTKCEEAEKTINNLNDSLIGAVNIIKSCHIVIGAEDNRSKDLEGLYEILNKFVLSKNVVEIGVISEARN